MVVSLLYPLRIKNNLAPHVWIKVKLTKAFDVSDDELGIQIKFFMRAAAEAIMMKLAFRWYCSVVGTCLSE